VGETGHCDVKRPAKLIENLLKSQVTCKVSNVFFQGVFANEWFLLEEMHYSIKS
jgi:hypothetical protein